MSVLVVAVVATRATGADQPPTARDSKDAAQTTPGKSPEKRSAQAVSTPPAGSAGAVVFVDPTTRKMVEPTAAEIGGLIASPSGGVAPKAPVTYIQGPGGAVGIVLGPESFSYAVVTRTADGKLALDCVTGDKAAASRVADDASRNPKVTPKAGGHSHEQ